VTNTNDEKEVNEPEKKGFSLFAPLGNANDKKEGEENKPAFSGSLFGSKPTGGSLFGGNSNNTNGTSLFGNPSGDKQSGGLFGSKPAFSGSLFGNNGTSDNKESKPLFGGQ